MVRKKDPNNPGVIPGAKKTAVVKVMKDGIKAVMGKDGKMRYFDKDGKEIDEKDAFDEKVIEIDDDGDPNAEYEEQVDPLTGERKVRKKQVVVKTLKDGIKAVKGKDGKVRQYDKDGNEINEEDAFDKKVIEVDEDGDPNAQYEEYIDPITGERKTRKKEAKKQVAMKVMKDGIKRVVGKDGKVRQQDKDGNEINEDDAFETKMVDVPDDGDANAEYEE